MLNRIHAGANGLGYALGSDGVSGDAPAPLVSLVHGRFQLCGSESGEGGADAGRENPAGRHQLDRGGAVLDLFPHRLAQPVGSVDLAREADVVTVAAGDGQSATRGYHPGTGHHPGLHGPCHLADPQAAQVANRRHARSQVLA